MRKITIFASNNVRLLDLAVATELFGQAQAGSEPAYQLTICSEFDEVTIGDGLSVLRAPRRLDSLSTTHTIIVLGSVTPLVPPSESVKTALRLAASHGTRIAAVSTGAFVLGFAGLLVGRRATTAEHFLSRFKEAFPETTVLEDPFVDEMSILTSGDFPFSARLALGMIARDFGKPTSDRVRSVFFANLDRSQSSINVAPVQSKLAGLLVWAKANLALGLDAEKMIAQSGMSARTFHRQFQTEMQMSPVQWLRGEQMREAMRLLEDKSVPLDSVWHRTGFERERTFRTQFKLAAGISPSAYRSHKTRES